MMSQSGEMHAHLLYMGGGTVGKRIKRAREMAGLGQAEMARRLGVTAVTAYRWEADRVSAPLDQLRRIAEVTGVRLDELLPEDDRGEAPEEEPVADDPEQQVELAQLALAAATSPDNEEAKRKLNEAIWKRARALTRSRFHRAE